MYVMYKKRKQPMQIMCLLKGIVGNCRKIFPLLAKISQQIGYLLRLVGITKLYYEVMLDKFIFIVDFLIDSTRKEQFFQFSFTFSIQLPNCARTKLQIFHFRERYYFQQRYISCNLQQLSAITMILEKCSFHCCSRLFPYQSAKLIWQIAILDNRSIYESTFVEFNFQDKETFQKPKKKRENILEIQVQIKIIF